MYKIFSQVFFTYPLLQSKDRQAQASLSGWIFSFLPLTRVPCYHEHPCHIIPFISTESQSQIPNSEVSSAPAPSSIRTAGGRSGLICTFLSRLQRGQPVQPTVATPRRSTSSNPTCCTVCIKVCFIKRELPLCSYCSPSFPEPNCDSSEGNG